MVGIEVLFGALIAMFGLIGLVRGFLRELGVTMVMVFTLFFLNLVDPLLSRGTERLIALIDGSAGPGAVALYTCCLYLIVIVVVAFISYESEALTYAGVNPGGPPGLFLGLLIGLVNGYLIAGALWNYMHVYQYPIAWLGFTAQGLSPLATQVAPLLPVSFLGQEAFLGQSMLFYLSILLLVFRVIR